MNATPTCAHHYASAGSRALMDKAAKEQQGVPGGGKKMMAALSLATVMHMAAAPTARAVITVDGSNSPMENKVLGSEAGSDDTRMDVSAGGVANNTTVNDDGRQEIYAGGVGNATTINGWPGQTVHFGGSADGTILNEGQLYIRAGGRATNIAQANDGIIGFHVSGGASTLVQGDGYYGAFNFSASNGQANNFKLHENVNMHVEEGGVASGTVIDAGGRMDVYYGGVNTHTSINAGGQLVIQTGTSSINIVQHSGGNIYFSVNEGGLTHLDGSGYYGSFDYSNSGVINNAVVHEEITMAVHMNGQASGTILINGGHQQVYYGGIARYTIVNLGCSQDVLGDGTTIGTIIHSGGHQSVHGYGGLANSTIVNNGGGQYISSSGIAVSTTVNNGGEQHIDDGGLASATIVNPGGEVHVYSGGTLKYTSPAHIAGSAFVYDGGILNASAVNLAHKDARLVIERSTDDILVTVLSGAGGLVKLGAGALTLNGVNTHSGVNSVEEGTLKAGGDNTLGAGIYDISPGAILDAANTNQGIGGLSGTGEVRAGTGVFAVGDSRDTSFDGTITGTGTLRKTGSGTLTLTKALNYGGKLNVDGGTLALEGPASHAVAGSASVAGKAVLSLRADTDFTARSMTLGKASVLNLASYDGSGTRTLISTADGISGDFGSITVAGNPVHPGGDVLATFIKDVHAGKSRDGKRIEISPGGLSWHSDKAGQAHGVFTTASNFTLNAVLADRAGTDAYTFYSDSAYTWDGKTLEKRGPATLTLANAANSHTGGNLIREGALRLSAEGAAGTGTITSLTGTRLVATYAGTLANRLSGAGVLVKNGAGTLSLSNARNDNSGGVHINAGTLRLIAQGAAGTGTLRIADGAALEGAFQGALDNRLTGQGGFVKSGGDTLTLSNAKNTYTGGTEIQGGALRLTTAGAAGSGAIQASAGAVLDVAHAGSFSTLFSGAGILRKSGSGLLEIGTDNRHSGGTEVTGGTLRLSTAKAAGTGTVSVARPATLDIAYAGTLSNRIQGEGTLLKATDGMLTIDSADSAIGAVRLLQGSFLVGTQAGGDAALTVTRGLEASGPALLGGHGRIAGAVRIGSGGVLSPGTSYGTLTIDDNLVMQAGSFYDVEVDRADSKTGDKTVVSGTVSLAGTMRHLNTGGAPEEYADPDKSWTILEAGKGVKGTFDQAVSDLAFLIPYLTYEQQRVLLSFRYAPFRRHARTFNQKSVADALETLNKNGTLYKAILGTTTAHEARRLLDSLSGEIHSSLAGNLYLLDSGFARNYARHQSRVSLFANPAFRTTKAPPSESEFLTAGGLAPANGVWVRVGGSYTDLDGDGNAGRTSMYGPEVTGGYDRRFAGGWFGGLGFRYSYKDLDLDSRDSDADLNSFTAALYGGREFVLGPGTLRLTASGAFAHHDIESGRKVRMGAAKQHLEAEYSAEAWLLSLEAAYLAPLGSMLFLEPFLSGTWHNLRLDGFTESGGSAALRKSGKTYNRGISTLGLRFHVPTHERFSLSGELAWRHAFGRLAPESALSFREGSSAFTIRGNTLSRDELAVGLGGRFALTDRISLDLNYDGLFGDRGQSHGGAATLTVRW